MDESTIAPTEFLDHESPQVRELVASTIGDEKNLTSRAVALFYAVRDGLRYEVYGSDLSREGMRASAIIDRGYGFCIHKSLVYAAAVRAAGIPSRLVFGDVRNHLASPRLRELVGGDLFRFHCLTEVQLDGRWIRATPVFNRMLCRLYRIAPLDFDGRTDSVYHPYDEQGRRHMEFVRWHGEFADFPYDLVVNGIRDAHPRLFASSRHTTGGSLEEESADQRRLLERSSAVV
ncbi:transglutaminase-like domain-containing protein [Actinophytocola xanthii]|uniref:Transglutaminase-like superfamily protein n=1 Tax=Actinophytocola xanthii TaxID=1912961 RepID=A0A1Q8CY05_9PSEU|nr:transglutaminase-like domain-containing protein [Actinophytocola xanthii]OLF19222.1 transglutaminase-like superfamily protein [Actinophytocola xanthii]